LVESITDFPLHNHIFYDAKFHSFSAQNCLPLVHDYYISLSHCFGRKTRERQPVDRLQLASTASDYTATTRSFDFRVEKGGRFGTVAGTQYSQSHPMGLMQVPLPLFNPLAQLFAQTSGSHGKSGYRIVERGCGHPADALVVKSVEFPT
jgi:hypothetical protein